MLLSRQFFAILEAIFAFMEAIVALPDRPIRFTQPKKIGPTTTLTGSYRRRTFNFFCKEKQNV